MISTVRRSRLAAPTVGELCSAVAALVLMAIAMPPSTLGSEPPSLIVLGFASELADEAWRDHRLQMGLRGQLTQMLADSGAFILLEEKELAASVSAADGSWLQERRPEDLAELHRTSGADWVVHGNLVEVNMRQDQVRGIVSGRRWSYRATVRLCIHGGGTRLCQEGIGRSVTRVAGAVVEYRNEEVAFDQAGPAQAVARALLASFNKLMPEWERPR